MGVSVDEAGCGEGGRSNQDHWGGVDIAHVELWYLLSRTSHHTTLVNYRG